MKLPSGEEKQNEMSISVQAMIPGLPLWNNCHAKKYQYIDNIQRHSGQEISYLEIPQFPKSRVEFYPHEHIIPKTPRELPIIGMTRKQMRLHIGENRQEVTHEI